MTFFHLDFPTKRLAAIALVLIIRLAAATPIHAQAPTHDDVAFATVSDDEGAEVTLRLDLWRSAAADEPAPLLIWVHGGAWLGGSYNSPPPALRSLLEAGFAVASVQYRLSGASIFPAQIHDVKGAVRFLRSRAEQYNLDPDRFAVWGSSAGGHLAALLATSGDVADAEGTTGGNLDYSSQIQAAVDYFGPTDLMQMNSDVTTPPGSVLDHDAPNSPEAKLIGFDGPKQGMAVLRDNLANAAAPFPKTTALARLANPIEHVTSDDPPIFIAHGDQDPLVPLNQSTRLATALEAAGVDHEMHVVEGGSHGFGPQGAGVDVQAIAFLAAQLTADSAP